MAYRIRTTGETQRQALDGISAEFPGLRTTEGSEAYAETLARARLATDGNQRLGQLERNVTPEFADERGANQWATALGVPRKGASTVRGTQALEISGTNSSSVSVGLQLTYVDGGLSYETTTGGTIVTAEPRGTVVVDIQSISTGSETRLFAGTPLRVDSPPAGVDDTATVLKDLVAGGRDEEALGAWRDRETRVWRDKRVAGSESGYTTEALALPDGERVFLYRRKPTGGSISVMAYKEGEGGAKLQTVSERQALEDELQDEIVNDTIIALVPVPKLVHVDTVVVLLPGNVPAFVGTYTVASWDAGSSTLTVNEALGEDVGVGDLLTIESADPESTSATGKPVTVAAVTGASTLVLVSIDGRQPVLDFVPAVSDVVYPSSPAMHDAWSAIRFGASECTTLPGLEQLGPANPEFTYGSWLSDVRAAEIMQLAKSSAGIDDATITLSTGSPLTPTGADIIEAVEFAFPDDNQVEALLPGQVVVR